jgi:hypothetical protein
LNIKIKNINISGAGIMNRNIKFLEKLYLTLLIGISIVIIFTPLIINSGLSIVPEEVLEFIIIALLFGVGYILVMLYRKEVNKNLEKCKILDTEKNSMEERLTHAFKHIGAVNVQIDEVRSAFSEIKKYPENKKDFKYILQYLGNRVLCMTDSDWIFFRIIDSTNLSTLSEYYAARSNTTLLKYNFSNKKLLENNSIEDFTIISSTQENFTIKTFCVIQSSLITKDQEIFIKAIVNQLEMLFLIFSSHYYKDAYNNKIESKKNYSYNITGDEGKKEIMQRELLVIGRDPQSD